MIRIFFSFLVMFISVRLCGQQQGAIIKDSSEEVIINGLLATSVKDKNKVLISWPAIDSMEIDYYSLERRTNDLSTELVGVIRADSIARNFQWQDENVIVGRHQYRLYVVTGDGERKLMGVSNLIMPGAMDLKFYPNPVDHVLIIRTAYPVDAMILDGQGMIRVPVFQVNGIHTVNLSSLEKGIYYIRFQNRLTGIVSQERLVKN